MSDQLRATDGIYSIGAVARMLGIPVATIRNWEARYGAVVPDRSPGKQRLYSREDVERLRFVVSEVSRGLSAADAHRLLATRTADEHPPPAGDVSTETRQRVLVAERDPVAADLQQFFLRTEGYDVSLAMTAADAEQQWLESRPDLAIVELMISGGRGVNLCQRLKQHDGAAVLAVSALEGANEALAAGADAFLQKPFDPLDLVATVKDLLRSGAPTVPGEQRPR